MTDLYSILRAVNVVMAVIVAVGLVCRVRDWRQLNVRLRFYGVGLFALMLSQAWAALESLWHHTPGGSRVYVLTASFTLLLIATFVPVKRKGADDADRLR